MTSFQLHPQLEKDCVHIRDLKLCRLLLMNDSTYPWCILVPMRTDIRDLHQLSPEDQRQFMQESDQLSRGMMDLFSGEKMNVAALGNLVPQLHIHHIVRFSHDACWPKPVWGQTPVEPYQEEQLQILNTQLHDLFPENPG